MFVHYWQDCGFWFWSSILRFCPTIPNFLINFRISVRTFPHLAQNIRRSRQKCILREQTTIWWKIGFRLESVTVFHKQLDFTQKIVGLLVKEFRTFVKAAFYLHEGSFWRKAISRKDLVFQIFLKLRGENNLTRNNLVCSLLTRLRFLFLELNFEFFSNNFAFSHQFCDFSKNFSYLAQHFWRSLQKCFSRVQTNIRQKTGFRLEKVTVFHKHLDFTQKLLDFW